MLSGLRSRVTAVATGAATAVSLLVAAAPPSRAAEPTNVLHAGQRLVANTNHAALTSRSGEFKLEVSPDFVSLDQWARMDGPKGPDFAGTGIWFRDDGTGQHQSNTDHSTLTLRRSGNLVLATSRGVVLWSSHTSGSGSNNRLVLRDSGNLVMSTASGKVVWATHTTRVFLPAGAELTSGARLVSRWGDQQGPAHVFWSLTMQRGGNLVLSCGGSVFWRSHTHVARSRLVMQKDGNLVIRGPHGRAIWSTHTGGAGPYTYFSALALEVHKLYRNRPLWAGRIPLRDTPRGCM